MYKHVALEMHPEPDDEITAFLVVKAIQESSRVASKATAERIVQTPVGPKTKRMVNATRMLSRMKRAEEIDATQVDEGKL